MRGRRRRRKDLPHKFTFKTRVWAEKKLYGSQVEASYAACGVPPICKSYPFLHWVIEGKEKRLYWLIEGKEKRGGTHRSRVKVGLW
jgi:hypothetical protein